MSLFRRKQKLPHQPLDDPLPAAAPEPFAAKKWLGKSIKQQLLARELENINQAIVNLRTQHQEFLRNISSTAGDISEAKPSEAKLQLPAIIGLPEKTAYFEGEFIAVRQELTELRTKTIGHGRKISAILPLPPTPLTVSEKAIFKNRESKFANQFKNTEFRDAKFIHELKDGQPIKELGIIKPADGFGLNKPVNKFKTLAEQLHEASPSVNRESQPQNLLEKLRYGIIELQQKWAEVQGRLRTAEYHSPEVNQQLKRLDRELNLLDKMSLETPQMITEVPAGTGTARELNKRSRKQARKEITDVISKISSITVKETPYELLDINKHLKELSSLKPQTAYVSRTIPPTQGHAGGLSAKQVKTIHQEVQEIIKSFSAISNKYNSSLEEINQKISHLNKIKPAKSKVARTSSKSGTVRELNKKRQKQAKKEITEIISKITAANTQIPYELLDVKKHLNELNDLDLSKVHISQSIPKTTRPTRDLSTKQTRTIHQEVREMIEDFSAISDKYQEPLKNINQKINNIHKMMPPNKITRWLVKTKDPYQTKLGQELEKTENLLARAIRNPSILLGKWKLKTKDQKQLMLRRQAKREVQAFLSKIEGALKQPNNELAQIKSELKNLKNIKLESGRKVIQAAQQAASSSVEKDLLIHEKNKIETELTREFLVPASASIAKTKELLEIEQKLAELQL